MLIDFKDEDFENKIKQEDISVIQFSAAWCGPCKSLKPVMDNCLMNIKIKCNFYYADIEDDGINTGSPWDQRRSDYDNFIKKVIEVDRLGGVQEGQVRSFIEKNI